MIRHQNNTTDCVLNQGTEKATKAQQKAADHNNNRFNVIKNNVMSAMLLGRN
jgi:hypothetical protein